MLSIETLSSQETVKLGEKLSRILEKKEVLILEGSLLAQDFLLL